MSALRRKGDAPGATYAVVDRDCIARSCFRPGQYESRGATMTGSRNTGHSFLTCMHNAYHGCPLPLPEPTKELHAKRKAEGWRNA